VTAVSSFFQISQLEQQRGQGGKPYLEFLRVAAMSAGLYVLAAGATDPQRPHDEDEIYYVVRGQACMRLGSEDQPVGDGSVIFVPADVEHRFHDITKELVVLVCFAPAES
jgi:quercetin dioxygenase-like cupin family protein